MDLGNQVLSNLGVEEPIEDVGVFFADQFYIQFFENVFRDTDFSQLEEAQTEEDMAANIEVLLKHLSQEILNYDLSHISGREIVAGNPEHCINLLQLANEISLMMGQEGDPEGEPDSAAKKRAFDEQKQDLKKQLQGDLPLKMDDVSIDLEEGMASHDPAAYEDDWKQMQLQKEYDPEEEDSYRRLNDDSAAESPDPLALAQEAMLHNAEAVDQEIEQIINKKLP